MPGHFYPRGQSRPNGCGKESANPGGISPNKVLIFPRLSKQSQNQVISQNKKEKFPNLI
jgi:hypothetical protein